MPRKQNGFGSAKGFNINGVNSRVDKGKGKGAAGFYPSNRQYGSSVHRSVIESYDLDSTWTKWRRGMEYYYQSAYEDMFQRDANGKLVVDANGNPLRQTINSKLYQGTPEEMDVTFIGWRYPTKNADTRNHYVVRRTNVNPPNLGTITAVENDADLYPDNKARGEIWVQGSGASTALRRMVRERITDGTDEATVTYVLTADKHPGIYIGKSYPQNTTSVTVSVPLAEILATSYVQENNNDVQCLVGEVGYLKNFFVESPITNEEFTDDDYYFQVAAEKTGSNQGFEILDRSTLPPSIYDIATLPKLYDTTNASYNIKGTYIYQKEIYQRFFGRQYLTADLVKSEVTTAAYTVMPFTILSVLVVGNQLEITSIPFDGEFTLYAPTTNGYLILADHSFTKTTIDPAPHALGAPGEAPWKLVDTDVDPWMDEIFTSGNQLKVADSYCCSCPDYSQSKIRMPETQGENGNVANRQARYPLPTVMSESDFRALGINQAAGIVQSWESKYHRNGYRMCKHTISTMFVDKLKTKEPNSYPTVETRIKFEEKLEKDIAETNEQFIPSVERSGISTVELVHSLGDGLNLDDVEMAYVLLNTEY